MQIFNYKRNINSAREINVHEMIQSSIEYSQFKSSYTNTVTYSYACRFLPSGRFKISIKA